MAVTGLSKYLFRPVEDVVRDLSALPVAEQEATIAQLLEASEHTAEIGEVAMSALGLDDGKLLELALEEPWRSGVIGERSLVGVRTAQNAAATLTKAQEAQLLSLGVGKHDFGLFLMGRPVLFEMPAVTDTQEALGGFVKLTDDAIASGIILVKDQGGGATSLFAFRKRTFEVARAFDRPHVDFLGCEIKNHRLGRLLARQGFEPATVDVPEDLGGGTMAVMHKRYDTRES